jgi:hypothetical protein
MIDKARENRARRKAARQGLILSKVSRVRDPDAPGYGEWRLDRTTTGGRAVARGTLSEIEAYLTRRTS